MGSAATKRRSGSVESAIVEDRSALDQVLPVPAVLLLVATTYAALSQGGYYRYQFLIFAVLVGAAALASFRSVRPTMGELGNPAVMAATLVAAATLATAALADGIAAAGMSVLAVTAMALAFLVTRRLGPGERGALGAGVCAVAILVAVTGWVGVAFDRQPWGLVDGGLRRAASTLTYANATAAFLAVGALVSLGRVVAGPHRRLEAVGLAFLLGVLGSTMSRAGMVALVLGVGLFAVVQGFRSTTAALWPSALGGAGVFVGLIPSSSGAGPARPGLAIAGLVGGGAMTWFLAARNPARLRPTGGRLRSTRPWVLAAAAGCALIVAAMASGASAPIVDNRLTVASPDRVEEWKATARLFTQHPLTGTGPGPFAVAWSDDTGAVSVALYTHNEYLQVLAQQGIVGGVAVFGGLVAVGLWLVATIRRSRSEVSDPYDQAQVVLAGSCVAALAGLGLHSALDFVWHVPVLAVLGAIVAGLAAPPLRPDASTRTRR